MGKSDRGSEPRTAGWSPRRIGKKKKKTNIRSRAAGRVDLLFAFSGLCHMGLGAQRIKKKEREGTCELGYPFYFTPRSSRPRSSMKRIKGERGRGKAGPRETTEEASSPWLALMSRKKKGGEKERKGNNRTVGLLLRGSEQPESASRSGKEKEEKGEKGKGAPAGPARSRRK